VNESASPQPGLATAEVSSDAAGNSLPTSPWGWLALIWGIGGVLWLLIRAIWRMVGVVVEVDLGTLGLWHIAFGVVWTVFMAYSEGYRAFQLKFCPRVVRRALWLASAKRPWLSVLAPMVCIGLVHASRKRLVVSWSIVALIVCLIIGVRMLAQPWRGLIDAGVVVGLGWGVIAILVLAVQAFRGRPVPGELDLPQR
jgi:hypothetical protein